MKMNNKNQYFQVECSQCRFIINYDKNVVCKKNRDIFKEKKKPIFDKLLLTCQNPNCGKEFTYQIDCRGFK